MSKNRFSQQSGMRSTIRLNGHAISSMSKSAKGASNCTQNFSITGA